MRRRSLLGTDWPGGWPPSNHVILLAILLLIVTAVALLVSTEPVANELATYAYFALVLGVVLRVLEHIAEAKLHSAVKGFGVAISHRVEPAVESTRERLGVEKDPAARYRHPRRSATAAIRQRRRVARLVAIGVGTGGLLIVFLQSREPGVAITPAFFVGWVLALWLSGVIYVVSR